MFENFSRQRLRAREVEINLVVGGAGPPVLLLHGYPQTHAMWHRVAPVLAESFTVVAADLRGYGDSDKPPSDDAHLPYSKRAMARDQVEVMAGLGFERFSVVGHDRGGRVGHRLALDHPERVERLAVLDIIPTRKLFASLDKTVATGYYHWFFLIQAKGFPEKLIGHDPDFYLRSTVGRWGRGEAAFTDEAMAEYLRCFGDPATIHASCEDYRAAASIDLEHDEADKGRKLACPLLALWGAEGLMGRHYDVLETWRERASDVRGQALACGHFLAEEAADETAAALGDFLAA